MFLTHKMSDERYTRATSKSLISTLNNTGAQISESTDEYYS